MDSTNLRLVVTGHVDHGKSTVTGRLLADTSALPDGKLEMIKEYCERNSKPFEYAFLLDALKDERSQGITIDAARIFFKTAKRGFVILDTPGHIEFLRNMVTGASRADAAVLVIDALEGVKENSKRHGYLLSFLGIRQIAVIINKMDLVGYDKKVCETITDEYSAFLARLGITAAGFIPASAMEGENISRRSEIMSWYTGPTLLEMLESFEAKSVTAEGAFRMPVQDVYRFSRHNDARRIVAGTVVSGRITKGDEIVFYPSGKRSFVGDIESFPEKTIQSYSSGDAAGFTMTEQVYITRGELAVKASEKQPEVTDRFKADIFWLGRNPLTEQKEYLFKLGSAKCSMKIEKIIRKIDASTLNEESGGTAIAKNEAAECVIKTQRPVAFDIADNNEITSRFVIVDDYDIRGGGVITAALEDSSQIMHKNIMTRNLKWASGLIDRDQRSERHGHRPQLVIITGKKDTGKKTLAKELEQMLFNDSRLAFFMGIANMLYGMDSDIKGTPGSRGEIMRRLSEMANIMLEAGHILIITAIELEREDMDIICNFIDRKDIFIVWAGDTAPADIEIDIHLPEREKLNKAALIIEKLKEKGVYYDS